jgi:hypothetical protein
VGFEVGRFGFQVGRGLGVSRGSSETHIGETQVWVSLDPRQAWVSPNPHHGSGETQDGSGSRERFGVCYVGFWLFY